MNVIKVTKINEDGSVAFEGFFGPNEVQFLLETGVNILMREGAISTLNAEEDDDDEDSFFPDPDEGTAVQ